jgi:hypothetical protein
MNSDERARAELERLITERREDFAGLSRLIGRNAAYIQQYLKRGTPRRLAEDDRRTLARYFGVDEAALSGMGASITSAAAKLVPIPRLRVGASAGSGTIPGDEQPVAHLAFDPAWLKQLTAAPASDLSIIRVQGDSMHPTLADGDDIMVDRSAAGTKMLDGIYVLRREDSLMVKRLAVHPGSRRLTIASDNDAYPTWRDCDPAGVEIIGRVVWAGRKIA